MKSLILSGDFTPNSNNRNTHWDAYYSGKKYRSSWEALYHSFDPGAEHESLRIKYDFEGKFRVYIVDFINHTTKTAIEVTPRELTKDDRTVAKLNSLREWCSLNDYTMIIADKEYLINLGLPDDMSKFDENTQRKIRKMHEIG